VQPDLTVGSGRRKARQTTEKYEHLGLREGQDSLNANLTDLATQEGVQYEREGSPGQLLHREPETSDRVLSEKGGLPTVENAKRGALQDKERVVGTSTPACLNEERTASGRKP